VIALLLALVLPLAPGDDLLRSAERAYHDGRYVQAHDLWLAALEDPQLVRGPLLFNLGACAYRMGQVPDAILWWHRARLRAPRDRELVFNLRRAERELGLPAAARAWHEWLTGRELLSLVVVLQSIGLLGLVLLKRRAARLALAGLVLATLPAVLALLAADPAREPRAAVLLTSRAALRAEPHAELPGEASIAAGTLLRLAARSDRWVLAECAAGRGWIERSAVGVVE
jgi:hypothetical protein